MLDDCMQSQRPAVLIVGRSITTSLGITVMDQVDKPLQPADRTLQIHSVLPNEAGGTMFIPVCESRRLMIEM